ncbi:MAG TPA: hypothetical protein VMD02_03340 [Candidatus Omnitrophota bacterium]|nr:hypothetical protein [Candidatus Omnitrophota bacterium]
MTSPVNQVSTFTLKTGWIRKAEFAGNAKIVIMAGPSMRMCTLAMDKNISVMQASALKDFFVQSQDCYGALQRIASRVPELPMRLSDISWIAISPRFSAGGKLIPQHQVLALNLKDVMTEIARQEKEKQDALHSDAATIAVGVDPATSCKDPNATVLSVEHKSGPGNNLFRLSAERFLSIPIDIMVPGGKGLKQKDNFGFSERVIDEVGAGNIGRYVMEMAIIREMFRRGMTEAEKNNIFNGVTVALRGDRQSAKPGYALRLAIKTADKNGLMDEIESKTASRIKSETKKIVKKIKAANPGLNPDSIAILTLAAYFGYDNFNLDTAVAYVKGQFNNAQYQEIARKIGMFVNDVVAYLNGEEKEEKRVITLRFVLDVIKRTAE